MSTVYFILNYTFLPMIPLLVVALGALISERSGVVNIALEGIMLMGAFLGIYVISVLETNAMNSQWVLIVGLLVGGITGALFSLLHAFAAINMKSDQIISATALNLMAPAFAIFVARTILSGRQQILFFSNFRIASIPVLGDIPVIGDIFFKNTYLAFYLALLILIIVSLFLSKTKLGLQLRSVGENPHAADSLGIKIHRIRYLGVVTSGFLAGFGGVSLLTMIASEFNATVSGYGFLALAVLIFGNWKPSKILIGAFFFGLMRTIGSVYIDIPFLNALQWPGEFYELIPFVATLVVLVFSSKNSNAPKAAGQIYDPGKR